jgi:hypothetical protein
LTKCVSAVAIGVERPESASLARGISHFFRDVSMIEPPVPGRGNINMAPRRYRKKRVVTLL